MSQQVMASKMAMQLQKQRLKGAQKGYELLKQKVDALKKRFHEIMTELLKVKKAMGKPFNEALVSFAEANYAAGEFRYA
jgi:V-type H+-transporting ATPase subunit D